MTKYRVVLDTNVYLSGIIFGGNSRHILDLIINKKIIAFSSPAILLEISKKLQKKFSWSKDQILITIKTLSKTVTVVNPQEKLSIVKSDKSDNKIIEVAVEARTNYIVTGDKHLLQIRKYQNVKIVSPAHFLSIYSQE